MGRFVLLDDFELLDGNLGIGEAGGGKVSLDELVQCSFVEPGFELFEDIRESYTRRSVRKTIREIERRERGVLRTRMLFSFCLLVREVGAAETRRGRAEATARMEVKRILLSFSK